MQLLDERYATQTKALDAAFKAAEQAVQTALVSAEKAVTKAETATDKRFESGNAYREQLATQAATFLTRNEAFTKIDALAEKLDDAVTRLDLTQGQSKGIGMSVNTIYMIIIVVGVVAGIIGHNFG